MSNPYRLPNKARVTIREILVWAVSKRAIQLPDLVAEFGVTSSDASVRLNKLWKWGYLARKKSENPPRIFRYTPTKFGRTRAKEWKKGL